MIVSLQSVVSQYFETGGAGSSKKRHALQKKLDLPERMTANAMLQALNLLYSPEDLIRIVRELEEE